MNPLEKWLVALTEQPVEAIHAQYPDEDIICEEIKRLPLPENRRGNTVQASRVSKRILTDLHTKLRGHECEYVVWDAVMWCGMRFINHPLPVALAHDLIDRCIATSMMAHTRQVDEVQWRLATLYEDALYTLICERYEEPEYSFEQFSVMREQYYWTEHYEGILYILSCRDTPSPEKKALLIKRVGRFRKKNRKQMSDHIDKFLKRFLRREKKRRRDEA